MIDTNKHLFLSEGTPKNPPGAYPDALIIPIIIITIIIMIIAILVVVFLVVLLLLSKGKGHTPVLCSRQYRDASNGQLQQLLFMFPESVSDRRQEWRANGREG